MKSKDKKVSSKTSNLVSESMKKHLKSIDELMEELSVVIKKNVEVNKAS